MSEESAWEEIRRRLREGLTGDIVLHCTQGKVVKYEIREVRRIHEDIDKPERLPVDLHT